MAVKQRIRKKARRDVNIAYKPGINAIDRAIDTADRDYEDRDAKVQNIYDSLQEIMGPQGGRYDAMAEDIMGDYTKALGDFSSAFSDSFAPAEAIGGAVGDQAARAGRAASNAYGTVGTGGIKLLADARDRNANYFGRMGNVAGLAEKDARLGALTDYESLIEDLKNRRLDLTGERSSAILTRTDELRQQRMDNRLAQKQFRLNKEQIESQEDLADYLIGHIGSESERRQEAAARRRRRARREEQSGGGGGGSASRGGSPDVSDTGAGPDTYGNDGRGGRNGTSGQNDGRDGGRVTTKQLRRRIDQVTKELDELTALPSNMLDPTTSARIFELRERLKKLQGRVRRRRPVQGPPTPVMGPPTPKDN